MIVWPSDLNPALRADWSVARGDSRIPTRADRGPATFKRGYSRIEDTAQHSIYVDNDLRALFEKFYIEDTRYGALPFAVPDFSVDGLELLTEDYFDLLTEGGAPILLDAWWLAMFGSMPSTKTYGAGFMVSFTLLVLPL